ncbi:unnamed protein product [Paramecium primaurelia]|uniref:Uncharacterized protein n=1 Tax=Paramecium primaurelia TaxID=5886 RepID=A0A8S1QQF2_PARPR|nr:unnamed protein product [Paramecium primaurelia]
MKYLVLTFYLSRLIIFRLRLSRFSTRSLKKMTQICQKDKIFGGLQYELKLNFKGFIIITFYILYGPEFSSDGLVEKNEPVSKSTKSYNNFYSNGEKYRRVMKEQIIIKIYQQQVKNASDQIKAYCGFKNYYVAVHKCQPYCLQCLNETTCTQWSSDYVANVVKFSQKECLIHQYYDNDSYRCLNCPLSC